MIIIISQFRSKDLKQINVPLQLLEMIATCDAAPKNESQNLILLYELTISSYFRLLYELTISSFIRLLHGDSKIKIGWELGRG